MSFTQGLIFLVREREKRREEKKERKAFLASCQAAGFVASVGSGKFERHVCPVGRSANLRLPPLKAASSIRLPPASRLGRSTTLGTRRFYA